MTATTSDAADEFGFAAADAFLDGLLQETEVKLDSDAQSSLQSTADTASAQSNAESVDAVRPAATAAEAGETEGAEFDRLLQTLNASEGQESSSRGQGPKHFQQFRLDDADDDNLPVAQPEKAPVPTPSPPDSFSAEDLSVREVLIEFYQAYNPGNLPNVNSIVEKYRGGGLAHLWASLGVKYELKPIAVIDLLARTLYATTPLECARQDQSGNIEDAVRKLHGSHTGDTNDLLCAALASGCHDVLRTLVLRKKFDDPHVRPMLWKVLLGYLPLARYTEFNAIQGEKRTAYMKYRQDLLDIDESGVQAKASAASGAVDAGLEKSRALLDLLRNEVDTLESSPIPILQLSATRNSLVTLLFVYAHLNPDIKYVQGMNDIAAVVAYAFASDSLSLEAEADVFWCFSAVVAEIKNRFSSRLDETNGCVHKLVGTSSSVLSKYDVELARHLDSCEMEPGIFALRWFTLLFARDIALPEVVRVWDELLADPGRFELCGHLCVALVLSCREELMSTANVMVMAEVLQSAPKKISLDALLRKAWAICTLERRTQTPPFPQLSAADMVHEVAGAFFTGLFNNF